VNVSQAAAAVTHTPLGSAIVGKELARFLVWAPAAGKVEVHPASKFTRHLREAHCGATGPEWLVSRTSLSRTARSAFCQ
jgi:hypothetical protein